jgi:hypothetical protein
MIKLTLIHNRHRLWQCAMISPDGVEPLGDWQPTIEAAMIVGQKWCDMIFGAGLSPKWEIVRDWRE